MRPTLALLLAAGASLLPGRAAPIEPSLATALHAGARVGTLVVLRGEAPAQRQELPRGRRRQVLIEELQATTHAAAAALTPEALQRGEVLELWASRTLRVEVDAAGVRELAARSEVAALLHDSLVEEPKLRESLAVKDELGPTTWGLERLGIPEVWARFGLRGEGRRIGVIDTGVDATHPDLAGKVAAYRDFAAGLPDPVDTSGHGTHVAGTLVGGDASGVAIGLAPAAKLVVARAFGGATARSALLASMQWMLDPDGDPATDDAPDAVNMSWHSGPKDQEPFYRAIDTLVAADIFPSFSAGNSGPEYGLSNPKKYPHAVSSAATGEDDVIAKFSSKGPTKYKGKRLEKPDWSVPGKDIFSAQPGGVWQYKNGTSMAAPHTTALVTLLRQARPDYRVAELMTALKETARDLGPDGWDGRYGAGRLDGLAAIERIAEVGELHVDLRDSGGDALAWGTATALASGSRFTVDADGALILRLPPGTHSLRFEAFGHAAVELAVTLEAGNSGGLVVDLAPLAHHVVSMVVMGTRDLDPATVRVELAGTPLAAQTADAAGALSWRLPAGAYPALVTAPGHAPKAVTVRAPSPDREVRLRARAPLLLVDDDMGQRYDSFVSDALEEAGLDFDHFDRSRSVLTSATLAEYPEAIWMTGTDSRGTFTSLDQEVVQGYLAGGGRLVASGQDIAYDHKRTDFLRKTLRTWFDRDNSEIWRVEGLGMNVEIDGGDGASNQDAPDRILPMWGSKTILIYPEERPKAAAIQYKNSFTLLAFGLEAVTPRSARAELLVRILAALRGDDPDAAAAALGRRGHRRAAFRR